MMLSLKNEDLVFRQSKTAEWNWKGEAKLRSQPGQPTFFFPSLLYLIYLFSMLFNSSWEKANENIYRQNYYRKMVIEQKI